jgi:uncharacterized membrane protein YfcA
MDLMLVVAGAITGFLVGLMGIGGGALMTPLLLLLFGGGAADGGGYFVSKALASLWPKVAHFRYRKLQALAAWANTATAHCHRHRAHHFTGYFRGYRALIDGQCEFWFVG